MVMGIIAIAVILAIFGIIMIDCNQQQVEKDMAKPQGPHRIKV
ncbi:MAG TPA: hypothetical protein VFC84_17070 [Desulfosporosinus sp.]|nr:hypothetical protein [Desulfosporosinus sp.]